MTTNTTLVPAKSEPTAPLAAHKVVIVNGTPETFDLLEMMDAGRHYDVVVVESNEHAYSQVRRVQPNLVVLCMRIDDPEGFRVLSMLKLDEQTRRIPVLTYTTTDEGETDDDEVPPVPEEDMFAAAKPALSMN